jgi:hypothetical protein
MRSGTVSRLRAAGCLIFPQKLRGVGIRMLQ